MIYKWRQELTLFELILFAFRLFSAGFTFLCFYLTLGLCIAGGDGEDSWVKHSAVEGRFCLSHRHDSCQDDDTHCIGNENTLFAYKVVA